MAEFPVVFDDRIPERDRSRIEAALGRVAIGEGPGRWREPPSWIGVIQELTDGYSGALVLRIELGRGPQHHTRIVKIGSGTADEWKAFKEIIGRELSTLCPPIEAVTEGVLDPRHVVPGEDEALVYTDVEQFADADATSLEDLVANAANGDLDAVEVAAATIGRLLHQAATVLYGNYAVAPGKGNRQSESPSLGAAMRVRAERIERPDAASAARAASAGSARQMLPRDVLMAALDLTGTAAPTMAADHVGVGSAVILPAFDLRREGDRWLASREYVAVEIAPGDGPGAPAFPAVPRRVAIRGTVEATRSALAWDRILRVMPGTELTEPGVLRVADTRIAHPFAALRQLLMGQVTGLVTATVHGDMNPRNVLIAGTQPFLIDYARARRDAAILGDLAWLEINLLRGPLSAALSFAELAHLQRLLALGDRMASVVPGPGRAAVDRDVIAALAESWPRLSAALRILGAIRHHARLIYPKQEGAAGPWWREYATQLVLAVHRTFKWPPDMQSECTWRAQVAAAGVATEQLLYLHNPWRLWRHQDLAQAAAAVLPLLPPARAALSVLGDLMSGLDLHGLDSGGQLAHDLQRACAGVLGQIQAVAPSRMGALQRAHDRYIDLEATDLGRQQPPFQPDHRLESAPRSALGHQQPGASALTIAADCARLIVVGRSGTGKTALLDELEYRCIVSAGGGIGPERGPAGEAIGRLPLRALAPELARACAGNPGEEHGAGSAAEADISGVAADRLEGGIDCLARRIPVARPAAEPLRSLLAAGAVHLMVDDFEQVPADGRVTISGWLNGMAARFPRILITVCHRGTHAPAELRDWRGVILGEPTQEQVLGYLARCAATGAPSAAAAAALVAAAGDRPAEREISALTRIPLLLSMLASTTGGADQAPTVGDLLDAYVPTLGRRAAAGRGDQWIRCAEALAEKQISSGAEAMTDELLLADSDRDFAALWSQAREQLIELGVLARDGSVIRFCLQAYHDYFGARALRTCAVTNRDELTARVLSFGWRDAFAIFVSFTPADPDVLRALIRAVTGADPCYGGRLLRSAACPPDDLVSWFLTEQERGLCDELMGLVAQERAAQALAAVAAPASYRRLLAVLSDAAAGRVARELSLAALVGAHRDTAPRHLRARLRAELAARLRVLLAGADVPKSLLVAAIRAVGDLPVHGLELLLADRIDQRGPWPVVREARSALEKLGVLLPGALEATYRQACARRLTQIERDLPTATSPAHANQLQAERCLLLDGIRDPSRLPELLGRRFAFEIGDVVGDLLDESAAAADGGQDVAAPGWLAILSDRAVQSAGRLLPAIGGPDTTAAAAAAHRLLRDQPGLAVRAFEALAGEGGADRALLAAAMALQPAVPLGGIIAYFRLLLSRLADEGSPTLEGLAALTRAISIRDPVTGIRLAWQAHRYIAQRGRQERLRWPWSAVMARFGGTPAQLDKLLAAEDDADFELGVGALAASGFLLIAAKGPQHRFSAAAGERLLRGCREMNAREIPSLLQAGAAIALPEVLTAVVTESGPSSLGAVIAGIESRSAAILALPGFGLLEVAPLAEALAAIGYLGRLSPRQDDMAEHAYRLLREIDLSDAHPSVETGRLIGLCYLGDWQPAVRALGSDDRRLPLIARNAIELWSPGPWTPEQWARPTSIAAWIANRLGDANLAPESRSALLELTLSAEQRAGALQLRRPPAGSPPASLQDAQSSAAS